MSSASASRSQHHPQGILGSAWLCLLLLLTACVPATGTDPGIKAQLTRKALEFGGSRVPDHPWGNWAGDEGDHAQTTWDGEWRGVLDMAARPTGTAAPSLATVPQIPALPQVGRLGWSFSSHCCRRSMS